ncbi:MAG: transposase [Flavobacteriales bacterium]|nr:transposase [Flavobacteriales bacterium]
MMKTGTVRQSIGIDCAKDEFVAAYCCSNELRGSECKQTRAFKNNKQGFARFMAWQEQAARRRACITHGDGGHRRLSRATRMCALRWRASSHVVLPNKAKAFARSINLRSVDDGSSARTLPLMGMERQLDPWEKPREVYIRMKHLTREREDIQQALASAKNQLHAEEAGAFSQPRTLSSGSRAVSASLERQVKPRWRPTCAR